MIMRNVLSSRYRRLVLRAKRAVATRTLKRTSLDESEVAITVIGSPFKAERQAATIVMSVLDDFGGPIFNRNRGVDLRDTKLSPGEPVRFEVKSPCRIRLLCRPDAGRVRIAVGSRAIVLNLCASERTTLEFQLPDDFEWMTKSRKSANVITVN